VSARVGVVMVTRNRRELVAAALDRLPAVPAVVVDNASTDGTAAAAGERCRVIPLARNVGAGARNVGLRAIDTPYCALTDDDAWWEPGALDQAAAALDADPRLAVVAPRVLVGVKERLDPACALMAASPLGRRVLGFVACAAVVRVAAVLGVGGFDARYGIGGEEQRLSLDLASAGWQLAYVPEVVAHHDPPGGPRPTRQRVIARNDLWTAWLRRPLWSAVRRTVAAARRPEGARVVLDAMRGARWVARERRPVPARVERELRLVERYATSATRSGPSSPRAMVARPLSPVSNSESSSCSASDR
jgi:GT2 family glycosyltransferase